MQACKPGSVTFN